MECREGKKYFYFDAKKKYNHLIVKMQFYIIMMGCTCSHNFIYSLSLSDSQYTVLYNYTS